MKKVTGMAIDTQNDTLHYLCGALSLFRRLAKEQGWGYDEAEAIITRATKKGDRQLILAELAKYTDGVDARQIMPTLLGTPV